MTHRRGVPKSPAWRKHMSVTMTGRGAGKYDVSMAHLYASGYTVDEVAALYGLTYATAHFHIKKHTPLRRSWVLDTKSNCWAGDDVSYSGLHYYVRKRLTKPDACPNCHGTSSRIELANRRGRYVRDLDEWLWLCAKCHREYDQSGLKLAQRAIARRAVRTECKNGHLYAVYGFYIEKDGGQRCKRCQSIASARYYKAKLDGEEVTA